MIVNAIDKPGPRGNEVNNIFAVVEANKQILGWLYTSFDKSVMFEPLAQEGSRTFRVSANLPGEGTFNAAPMLESAFRMQEKLPRGYAAFVSGVSALHGVKHVSATLVPCFSRPWDGTSQ